MLDGTKRGWQCSSSNIFAVPKAIFNFYECKLKSMKRQSCWFAVCQDWSSRLEATNFGIC